MSKVKVIAPGPMTTVQDSGRFQHQRSGMSLSGVMDSFSHRTANLLVGNPEGEAVLEATLLGPTLEFLGDSVVAVTGGEAKVQLNSAPAAMWQGIRVKAGDKLSFQMMAKGCRLYIAFAGGIDVPVVMDSKSTYMKAQVGGLEGRSLKRDDELRLNPAGVDIAAVKLLKASPDTVPACAAANVLRVVLGPQEEAFTEEGIKTFLSGTYTVTPEADRMGYRLEGEAIAHVDGADIISDGIVMGAIQVPGSGKPIILMSDRQTTGGYTKIATVVSADLPKVGQARPGDTFTFQKVSVEEAQEILFRNEAAIKQFAEKLQPVEAPAAPAAAPVAAASKAPEDPEVAAALSAAVQALSYPARYWPPSQTHRYTIKLGTGETFEVEVERSADGR